MRRYLVAKGVKAEALSAEELLITDDAFGHANPLLDETRERVEKQLVPRMHYGTVPVVTGFVGSTVDGVTTTLGRGGSDYSAAVFAASCSTNRRARVPTVTRPCLSMRTTDGVTVAPCALRTTDTRSPSNTAAAELVVPRSIPT